MTSRLLLCGERRALVAEKCGGRAHTAAPLLPGRHGTTHSDTAQQHALPLRAGPFARSTEMSCGFGASSSFTEGRWVLDEGGGDEGSYDMRRVLQRSVDLPASLQGGVCYEPHADSRRPHTCRLFLS